MTEQDIIDSGTYYEHLSLYVCPETPHAAKLSCGGVIEASMAVAQGHLRKTFAIIRPPGHHAEPEEHMGFCFFNNIAVAARVVQQLTPIKKILILDWDVHHGLCDIETLHLTSNVEIRQWDTTCFLRRPQRSIYLHPSL